MVNKSSKIFKGSSLIFEQPTILFFPKAPKNKKGSTSLNNFPSAIEAITSKPFKQPIINLLSHIAGHPINFEYAGPPFDSKITMKKLVVSSVFLLKTERARG